MADRGCESLGGQIRRQVLRHESPDTPSYRGSPTAPDTRPLEEVIRVCKAQLELSGCQARTERAQLHHLTCRLVAFCVLAEERHE